MRVMQTCLGHSETVLRYGKKNKKKKKKHAHTEIGGEKTMDSCKS